MLRIRERYSNSRYFSFGIIILLMTGYLFLEIKNERFTAPDFKVYYNAASDLMSGENMYRHADAGHYVFKYSPVFAFYFIPFALFPFSVAKAIYWLFLVAVICYGINKSYALIDPGFGSDGGQKRYNNLVLLTALIIGVHAARELELGQVNHLLFVLYIIMIWLLRSKKEIWAALVLAGSVFIKPFGLIFIPWLILRKKYRMIGYFALFVPLVALLPVIFTGIQLLSNQYYLWFNELSIELAAKQSLLSDGNHTIFSLIARFTPFRWTALPVENTIIFQLIITGLIATIFFWLWRIGKNSEQADILEAAILITMIPMLTFTSYNAFGFAELAVCMVLFHFRELDKMLKIAALSGFILLGGNIYDLVGRSMWQLIDNYSLVSIGALLLVISLAVMRIKKLA